MKRLMKRIYFIHSLPLAVGLIFGALAFGTGSAYGGWQLVWTDDFTNANGSYPDPTKWTYDTGGGGWGNDELETYTTTNATIQNSQLVIQVDQIISGGTTNYTSTRMKTEGLGSWAYGRIEASIKIPRGQGIWPAFWMLGTNITTVNWPTCGEIDIMENIGNSNNLSTAYGTIHGPQNNSCGGDYNCGSGVGGSYTLPGGAALSDGFHIYAVQWTTNQIQWFVDTNLYFTATPASLPPNSTWVFTAPQFIVLNVAVGGQWPGDPDATTVFPQQMLVQYVHVYTYVASAPAAPTGLTVGAGNTATYLSWNASTGATAYNVKRSLVSGGPYTTIASPATNNYVDTGVSTCSSYYYVVSATNSLGESVNSSEAAVSLGAFALAVNSGGGAANQFIADTNFSGGTQASPTTATIDTSAVTNPAPQAVYQSERYGNCTYTFTNLTQGVNYKVRLHFAEIYWTAVGQRVFNVFINGQQVLTNYDIIAVSGAENKANIQEFMAAPTTTNTIVIKYVTVVDNAKSSGIEILIPRPAAPAGLTATAGNSLVALTWNTLSGATGYNVKRSLVNGGPYTLLSGGLTVTNYTDSVVTNGTTYYYVVSTVNNGCESTNSAQVSATPVCTPPAAPTAGNNGPIWAGTTLNLTASTVAGATYSWTGPNGFTSASQNPSIANATTNASGLYSVTVTVGGCTSPAGTTAAVVNLIPAPLGLTATAGNSLVALTWNTSTAATGYNVKRSLTNGGPYTLLSGGLTVTNCTDSVVTNGTAYYYVVSAVNTACESTNSIQVSATPVCTPPAAPTAGNNGPIWAGATLNLTASTVSGATYSWTGPNGFTSASQNPSIANATTNASGLYSVTATVGGCTSPAGTTTVVINPVPMLSIQWVGSILTLSWPGGGTLQMATNVPGQWYDLTGATNPYPVILAEPQQFYRVKLQ